jgi:imidazolonepropionase
VEDGAVAVRDGRIVWAGPRKEAPPAGREHDCGGLWLTPGLVDCHTHIVHAGNRSGEWEARLNGASYEDIARQGGGIMSTVRATRAASEDALLRESAAAHRGPAGRGRDHARDQVRLRARPGSEAKMLRVARRVGGLLPVNVATTFLGAHALPPEFAGRADDYIDEVCERMLPAWRKRAWSTPSTPSASGSVLRMRRRRACSRPRGASLPVKLHAEQLSDQGGAALVAEYGGLSADHLEHLSAQGAAAMARAGTVAVLLPGAYYFLRETVMPPLALLREPGCRWPWPPTAIPAPRP